jgi:hypothetical protein
MKRKRNNRPKMPPISASLLEWQEYEKAIKQYEEDNKKKKELIQRIKNKR